MQLSKRDMSRLFTIFAEYADKCDQSASGFLDYVYSEIDEDCIGYGFKPNKESYKELS